jgi:phosphoglycerate dehydrogenase-like enzyme
VELAGRTVGVVGLGRIGIRVCDLARGIGMRVTGVDPDPIARTRATAAGVRVTDLPDLLRSADAVVLAASRRYGDPPVLGARELGLLHPHVQLVNVARAQLVDTRAVLAALRSGALRGYAVDDVVADPDRDADLLDQGRLVQTRHSAWWRDETLERGARMWGERILAALAGAAPASDTVLAPTRPIRGEHR